MSDPAKIGPSLTWAIGFYGAAAFLGYRFLPTSGWIIAMGAVFMIRGAMDIPLFRDDQLNLSGLSPEEYRKRRLNSFDAKTVRFVSDIAGKFVGALLLIGIPLGILIQLPNACSGPTTSDNEYRAR